MNYLILELEIETMDGVLHKQPNCRIKTTPEGHVMMLIKDKAGKWHGVKGKVFIKGLKLKKEYYIHSKNKRIPAWLIKLFGIKI